MKYDFTTEYNRHGMDALAVDGLGLIPGKSSERPKKGFDVIPMWGCGYELCNRSDGHSSDAKKIRASAFWLFYAVKRVL